MGMGVILVSTYVHRTIIHYISDGLAPFGLEYFDLQAGSPDGQSA